MVCRLKSVRDSVRVSILRRIEPVNENRLAPSAVDCRWIAERSLSEAPFRKALPSAAVSSPLLNKTRATDSGSSLEPSLETVEEVRASEAGDVVRLVS